MKICITGSNGLIGSAAAKFFLDQGHEVIGVDNNMRQIFFGSAGSTLKEELHLAQYSLYQHFSIDIRNKLELEELFKKFTFDVIIHCAAQPSHDRARDIILLDFEVNAVGTMNLLDLTMHYCPDAIFLFTSTNKVYGDNPNKVDLVEDKKRFTFKNKNFHGFDESTSLDACLHSFFGVSKTAADLYVQEFGRNLGLKTTLFRLGCVTGANHASVKLHGFLSYLVKCAVHKQDYEIIGYKGKQVRDQIHADDVAMAFDQVIHSPKKGAVYNLGGEHKNSASVLELIDILEKKLSRKINTTYEDQARLGDHICYITDATKFKTDYPDWSITKNLNQIIDELIAYETTRV